MTDRFDPSLLSGYLDDELSPDELALVHKVLAEQPEQRAELEAIRRVRAVLNDWPVTQPTADPVEAVRARIEQQRAAQVRTGGRWLKHWAPLLAMAATLLLAVGLLTYRRDAAQLSMGPGSADPESGAAAAESAAKRDDVQLEADVQRVEDFQRVEDVTPQLRRSQPRSDLGVAHNDAPTDGQSPPPASEPVPADLQRTQQVDERLSPPMPSRSAVPSPVRTPSPAPTQTMKSLDASARRPSTAAAPALAAPTGYYWYLPAAAEIRSPADSSSPFLSEEAPQRERRGAEARRADVQPLFDRATAGKGDAAEPTAGAIAAGERLTEQGKTGDRQAGDRQAGGREATTLLFYGRVPGDRWPEAQRQLRQQLESLGLQPTADGTVEPNAEEPSSEEPMVRQRVQAAAEPSGGAAFGAAVDGARPPLSAVNPQTVRVAIDASPETALALQTALEQQVRSLGGRLETTAARTAVGDGYDATPEMLDGPGRGTGTASGGMGGGATADFGPAPPLLRRNASLAPTQRPRMLIELSVDRTAAEPAAAPADPQP